MKIPFGEFAPDQSSQNKEVAESIKNCIPTADGYRSINGIGSSVDTFTLVGKPATSSPTPPTYTTEFVVDFGTSYDLMFIPPYGLLYYNGFDYYNGSIGSSSNVSPFVQWDNDTIIIYGANCTPSKLTKTNIITPSQTTVITGSPPKAATCAKVNEFLVVGRLSTGEYNRVQWSGFNNYESWTVGTNQSDYQDLEDGSEIQHITSGEFGLIFQRNRITKMDYIGSPLIFQFSDVARNNGTPAGSSVVSVNTDSYFLGVDGFYVVKDGVSIVPIGAGKVNKWFYDNADIGGIRSCYDYENKLVIWGFKHSDNSSLVESITDLLVYHVDFNKWAHIDLSAITSVGFISIHSKQRVAGSGVDIALLTRDLETNPTFNLYYLNGTALAATIETGEYSQEDALTQITEIRPIIDGTATVTTETRNLLSASVTSTGPTSTDSSGKANVRTNARYTRIKCTTSGDFTQAVGVEVKAKKAGKR